MTIRQPEIHADAGARVLGLIERFDPDPGDDALDELHQLMDQSPESERRVIETTRRLHAASVTLASEHSIDEWVAIAKEGFAADTLDAPAPNAARAAPAQTLGRLAGRAESAANESWFGRLVKPIALVAAVAAIGVMGAQWYLSRAGESKVLELPDTSAVRRFAQARIEVNFTATERRVDLKRGTAAFRVEHDPQHRPFKVYADNLVIAATGTQFNVFRRPGLTDVYLEQGSLDVFRHQSLLLKMKEGDLVHIRDGDGSLVEPPFHKFAVDGMTYAQIADAFNKENGVIRFEVRGAAKNMHPRPGNIAVFTRPDAWIEAIRADPSLRVTSSLGVVTIEATPSN